MAKLDLIFDVGANNGDDVAYYLLKARKVIAIEANAKLADSIRNRFLGPIHEGRLCVECCAVSPTETAEPLPFYIHKSDHVLSTLVLPDDPKDYERVLVPCRTLASLVQQYGLPDYAKLDIEGLDAQILSSMLSVGIVPPMISAEAHTAEVTGLLISCPEYTAFKVVEGAAVFKQYHQASILVDGVPTHCSFPDHSAGPFGEDIDGDWLSRNGLIRKMAAVGPGWRDIHAAANIEPNERAYTKADLLQDLIKQSVSWAWYKLSNPMR